MGFDKPDRRFRRGVIRGFFKRVAQASRWLRWLSATAKTVPFIDYSSGRGPDCDFINMLMIWFYAFAVCFAIRSENL
jgi:hypothetical protein